MQNIAKITSWFNGALTGKTKFKFVSCIGDDLNNKICVRQVFGS